MARLVFAILCEETSLRPDSTLDLGNAFVWMGVVKGHPVGRPTEDGQEKPLFQIVTNWMRSDIDTPESFTMRLRFNDPQGNPVLNDFQIDGDLTVDPQTILSTVLNKLPPLSIDGVYGIEVALKHQSKWKTIHRCPLVIRFMEPSEIQPGIDALSENETADTSTLEK